MSCKGGSQNRLSKPFRTHELLVEFGFDVVDGGGAGFDFGDDLFLFFEWR